MKGVTRFFLVASFLPYMFLSPKILAKRNAQDSPVGLEERVEETIKTHDEAENSIENKTVPLDEIGYYMSFISKNEGIRNRVYDPVPYDGKYEPTIGIGHNMSRKDSKEVFKRALPHVNYYDVLKGRRKLTYDEIKMLFKEDIQIYLERARKLFPNFNSYPLYLRAAILDGVYRGDLSGSPKTIKLINEGKFYEASIEYLNHKEYKESIKKGKRGIRLRMERNSEAMKRYSSE
ncbi:MAG: hypothetical protein QXX68_03175 [Candidatus Pacearchaeota archaeon]